MCSVNGGMKVRVRNSGRLAMMKIGHRGGARLRRRVQTLYRYVDLGVWAGGVGGGVPHHFGDRIELFGETLRHVTGTRPLYLEFGVYTGGSFRWWCENLKTPGARLVGFDSFEGLPEDWNAYESAGAFAVDAVPEIDDPRASFEVGWFDATVPAFEVPPHDQLIINIDSDLYSSAALVLSELEEYIVPGTLVYFDEFSDTDHELRAWREFLARTSRKVELLGMADGGTNWLFRIAA